MSQGRGTVPLTNIHAQGDAQVHVLGPGVQGGVFAEHGEDAAVQVGLARRLLIARDGDDGGARAVPRHQVCRPAGTTATLGLHTATTASGETPGNGLQEHSSPRSVCQPPELPKTSGGM